MINTVKNFKNLKLCKIKIKVALDDYRRITWNKCSVESFYAEK